MYRDIRTLVKIEQFDRERQIQQAERIQMARQARVTEVGTWRDRFSQVVSGPAEITTFRAVQPANADRGRLSRLRAQALALLEIT